MEFKIKKYPEKSWSISKMKVIEGCYREYYYTYYGSHNGWLDNSSIEAKISWRLKKLTNIWLLFGEKLHKLISEVFHLSKEVNIDTFKKTIRNNLNLVVKNSSIKAKDSSWDEYPKGEMLEEYYYNGALNKEDIDEIKKRIDLCVDNFYNCKTYMDIKINKCKVLEADEGKFDYTYIYDVKVFALIDVLYIDEKGNYIIVDWKTGKVSENDREQLIVYAIYVMEKYNIPLNKIKGRIEYLYLGEKYDYSILEEDVLEIKNRIKNDLMIIDNFLVDSKLNIPKERNVFRKCDNIKRCNKCKYRKLCFELDGVINNEIN